LGDAAGDALTLALAPLELGLVNSVDGHT
jgi:hypothetical protein